MVQSIFIWCTMPLYGAVYFHMVHYVSVWCSLFSYGAVCFRMVQSVFMCCRWTFQPPSKNNHFCQTQETTVAAYISKDMPMPTIQSTCVPELLKMQQWCNASMPTDPALRLVKGTTTGRNTEQSHRDHHCKKHTAVTQSNTDAQSPGVM